MLSKYIDHIASVHLFQVCHNETFENGTFENEILYCETFDNKAIDKGHLKMQKSIMRHFNYTFENKTWGRSRST